MATFLAVRADCRRNGEALATARDKAENEATFKPIRVAADIKTSIRAAYKSSQMHVHRPLTPSNDPNHDWWDAADTRKNIDGFMHNFPLSECISQAGASTKSTSPS